MYCKNCGKPLGAGDKFCSNCGQKAEEFVPAFKQQEAQTTPPREKPKKKPFHIEKMQWDLDGYPTDNKKTEEVDFDWNSVLEEKQKKIFESQLQEARAAETAESGQTSEWKEAVAEDLPAEKQAKSLEEELFAEIGTASSKQDTRVSNRSSEKIDKFYTYNQKNERLQAMLDQEYERIRSGKGFEETENADYPENGAKNPVVHEEFDWTLPPSSDVGTAIEKELTEKAEEKAEEKTAQKIEPAAAAAEQKGLQYVGVALSQPPKGYTIEITEEEKIEAKPAEAATEAATAAIPAAGESEKTAEPAETKEEAETVIEECPPSAETEKPQELAGENGTAGRPDNKLTFDDVFGADDDDVDERPKKQGKALKVIAILLCILVVIELAMIGIQYFAPESAPAKLINNAYAKVAELFGGSEEEVSVAPQESEITRLINGQIDKNKNIGTVEENADLGFSTEADEDYGFAGLDKAYAFENAPWYTAENGETVTYGDEIISTVIGYYSAWVDMMNGTNEDMLKFVDVTSDFYTEAEEIAGKEGTAYGINRLAIGEIKSDGSGFYVMVNVTETNSKAEEETAKQQIVYLEPDNKVMKIVEIKEI